MKASKFSDAQKASFSSKAATACRWEKQRGTRKTREDDPHGFQFHTVLHEPARASLLGSAHITNHIETLARLSET